MDGRGFPVSQPVLEASQVGAFYPEGIVTIQTNNCELSGLVNSVIFFLTHEIAIHKRHTAKILILATLLKNNLQSLSIFAGVLLSTWLTASFLSSTLSSNFLPKTAFTVWLQNYGGIQDCILIVFIKFDETRIPAPCWTLLSRSYRWHSRAKFH